MSEEKQKETMVLALLEKVDTLKLRFGQEEAWSRLESAVLMSGDLHQNNLAKVNMMIKILAIAFGIEHPGFTRLG